MKRGGMAVWLVMAILGQAGWAGEGAEGALFQWGGGARSLGMGKAFLAVADDATASYWNPAGLAQLRIPQVSALQAQLFEQTSFGFLAGALPLANGQTIGLNVAWISSTGIEGRDDFNQATGGTFGEMKMGVTGAYGFSLFEGLQLGVAVKYLHRDLGGASTGMAGLDLSALIKPFPGLPWSIGLVGQHLARQSFGDTADRLTPSFRMGVAVPFTMGWLVTGDVDQEGRWHVGSEYGLFSLAQLRLGTDQLEQSAGVGLQLGGVKLDYAAAFHRELGLSNRMSITILMGEE